MIPLSQALEIVDHQLAGVTLATETLDVRQALGRTVVADQIARVDLPPFDKSAMDGYAIPAGDQQEQYRLLETVPAGSVPSLPLTPGTATKVMTGAPVPAGAAKVVMVEQTCEADGKVRILSPSKGKNICRKGEDVRCGDTILKAPATLGPLEIANLVAAGITEVQVARRLRVSIISTGDEIVDAADQLTPGKIMNSNGPLLLALCQKHTLEVAANVTVPDQPDATTSALREALAQADIVLLSGGVSVGDFDYVAAAMSDVGLTLHFNRLATKPGKPMTFASAPGKAVFGLPGNPVAVYLMFHLFVLHAARLMAGQQHRPRYVTLDLACDYKRRNTQRLAFLPCCLTRQGKVQPAEFHGSAHLQALLECDGFFVVPQGVSQIAAGEKVDYISLKGGFE